MPARPHLGLEGSALQQLGGAVYGLVRGRPLWIIRAMAEGRTAPGQGGAGGPGQERPPALPGKEKQHRRSRQEQDGQRHRRPAAQAAETQQAAAMGMAAPTWAKTCVSTGSTRRTSTRNTSAMRAAITAG